MKDEWVEQHKYTHQKNYISKSQHTQISKKKTEGGVIPFYASETLLDIKPPSKQDLDPTDILPYFKLHKKYTRM